MANPNEYNDDLYLRANASGTTKIQTAVVDLWEAGSSEAEIAGIFLEALRDDPPQGFDLDEFWAGLEL